MSVKTSKSLIVLLFFLAGVFIMRHFVQMPQFLYPINSILFDYLMILVLSYFGIFN
ncbi:MAG: hypothetical protein GX550_03510, partial [Syntrophomonadaceae bacterium]|nr:hypothetical protein [Syntrophomonadaceae bacterium]